jgi:hypothetical protein
MSVANNLDSSVFRSHLVSRSGRWGVDMQVFIQRLSVITVLFLLICGQTPVLARGSQGMHDDPWNPEHIDRLPPEVRSAVLRMCKTPPHAAHYFATYLDNSRVIKLHFEHLHCEQHTEFCRQKNCLHQEYVSSGGHYRLLKSYYGRNDD